MPQTVGKSDGETFNEGTVTYSAVCRSKYDGVRFFYLKQ